MANVDVDSLIFVNQNSRLPPDIKLILLEGLVGLPRNVLRHRIEDYDGYFVCFASECRTWASMASNIALQTYRDLIDLIEHLRAHKSKARTSPEILSFFPQDPPVGEEAAFEKIPTDALKSTSLKERYETCNSSQKQNAISLAVKLWLLINCGPQEPYARASTSCIAWHENESLVDIITKAFKSQGLLQTEQRFPKAINSYSLERVAGFRIVWTEHLADHLLLNDEVAEPTVKLFRFPSILQLYNRTSTSAPADSWLLPEELLEETLQTFALILPCFDISCKKWFDKASKTTRIPLDPKARQQIMGIRGRNPNKYKFWGERLCLIKQAFDDSEPTNLSQWWNDRRNGARWYSFWGAIVLIVLLTILFGLISSVTGIMQVYIAYHPSSLPNQ